MLKAFALGLALAALPVSAISAQEAGGNRPGGQVLKGKSALGDWRQDKPGLRRHLTLQDVPPVGKSTPNSSEIAPMASNAKPEVAEGFSVELVVSRLGGPRATRRAPNGDLFIADTSANTVRLLRVPRSRTTVRCLPALCRSPTESHFIRWATTLNGSMSLATIASCASPIRMAT
jgi:hypothetical protein